MFDLKPCPFCGYESVEILADDMVGYALTPYCPNCGSKMDGGDNDGAD